jgi:hypothetical protein
MNFIVILNESKSERSEKLFYLCEGTNKISLPPKQDRSDNNLGVFETAFNQFRFVF